MRSGMVQYHDDLTPMMQPIDEIIQNPSNYNEGDVDEIMLSIETVGMYRPIIVARDSKEIIAGNHTWMACKALGAEVIPVVWFDGEIDAQMFALVADNGTARRAKVMDAQLLAILTELETAGKLMGTGYESPDLHKMQTIVDAPLDFEGMEQHVQKANWPTLFITVPPETLASFHELTADVTGGDRERLEFIMREAGWDG